MLILEILRVAFAAVRANKLRSFLTMLGIIIGIAAVITMVALGEGAQRAVQAQLEAMGTNVLTVRPGQAFFGRIDRGATRLTSQDAAALLEAPDHILSVAPEMERRQQVVYGGSNADLSVLGSWPTYFPMQNFEINVGRYFTDEEDQSRRRVAVLGADVGERLGGVPTELLVGETLRIRGIPFLVVGVLEAKGEQGWQNPDEGIYIPLATAQYRVFGTDWIRSISVQALGAQSMASATAEIDRILRREHRIRPGAPSDFNIRDQASLVATAEETARTFGFLLAGIALVSLLVGGIGIMNIMLVSVTERTREIGIRKALGAKPRDILLQFLIEALVLCLAGGALGLALGAGGAYALRELANWNAAVAPSAVGMAIGFAVFVGIVFGLWPARRAARLQPIAALRYE